MTVPVPGQGHLGPLVDRVDLWAERCLDRVRGDPLTDRVFATASHAGDFSLVWHVIGLGRGIALRRADETIVLAALLAVESLIVNQGLKRLFRRERPTLAGDEHHRLRRPSTSAFPSGHASSAAFAATILTAWDGPRLGVLWWSIAGLVGTSRVHVRIHHASDVIGGAVVGIGLGIAGRAVAARVLRRRR